MKKYLPVIVIAAILLVGAGVFLSQKRGKAQPKSGTEVEQTQEGGVFESIRDAMLKSLSLKCEYEIAQGKVTAYVKGKAVRIDGVAAGKSNSAAIIKEDRLWTWDTEKKEGLIMPLQTTEEKQFQTDQFINDLEAQKQFCRPTVVADSVFDPPADVKFQDLGELMKKIPSQE